MFKTNILMLRETKTAIRLKSITNVKELLIYIIYIRITSFSLPHPLVREISVILPAFDIFSRLQIRQEKEKKKK